MGLSCQIVVGGAVFAPPTTRPSFETLPVLQRLKVVPTAFQSQLAGDRGVWHDTGLIAELVRSTKLMITGLT